MPLYPDDLEHPLNRGKLSTLGVGWREMAGPLWRAPHHSVHVWRATNADDPRQRALDAAAVLTPGAALGTWAAACIAGAVELDGLGASGTGRDPVVVCLPPGRRMRRGTTLRPLRSPLAKTDMTFIDGVPVTVPVRTAFDCARIGTLAEAVVAIDYLGRGRPDFVSELAAYAEERPRWRGVPQVRRAVALATFRSRSAGETRFRLVWQLAAGLTSPHVNAEVRDGDGRLLGIVDLLDDALGLVGEYDGSLHRDIRKHADDNAREEWLEAAGLLVVRATGHDLSAARSRTVHRLQVAAHRARSGSETRRRWTWSPGPLPPRTPTWGPPARRHGDRALHDPLVAKSPDTPQKW